MALFVFAVLLGLVGIAGVVVLLTAHDRRRKTIGSIAGAAGLGLAALLVVLDSGYSQDTGDASVLVSFTGTIDGQETTPGWHWKAPWDGVQTFSVRNQQVAFAGDGRTDYSGGSASGPQITAQDSQGVTDDIDVSVRYSIRPEQVTDIYRQYRDESTFVQSFVVQTVRSVVRDVPNDYSTLDLLTKRSQVNAAIQTALEAAWRDTGVSVDNVSLQEIRPPSSVTEAYAAAQQAQIKVTTEKNNLEAAQVSAQQQVVQAEAKAKANDELNRSLTENVLKQNYLDTLGELAKSGNVVVVPEGFNGILNVK